MDSIVNNSEMNKIPAPETPNKVSKKIKNKSDDQTNDSRDGNTTEVIGHGKGDSDQNVHLQMQLQLENSLNMIDDIKKIISEYEQNYIKISKLAPEIDLASLVRNFDNQKFQEYLSYNKCTPESNSQKPARSEIIRKLDEKVDFKNSGNVSDIRALVKNCKSAINSLEKKLEDRTTKKYLSESPTESEEERSDDSVYDPRNTAFSRNASRKRRRSNKVTKAGKKSRGRPRKQYVDDHSSNSSPEIRGKKFRGRPRKTVVVDDDDKSSLSNSEPKAKKSRGRPRKHKVEDDTSSSVKESNDNVKQESDSVDSKEKDSSNDKNAGDSTEISEKQTNEVTEKRHKGRPKKHSNNDIEGKDKKPRGRPKSNLFSEIHKDAPEAANNDSVLVKSRGRPKKNKIVENEPSNSASN